MNKLRIPISGLVLLVTFGLTGCQHILPYEFQPHQLWKLNRGPALGRDTYNFSIPDPELSERSFENSDQSEYPKQ